MSFGELIIGGSQCPWHGIDCCPCATWDDPLSREILARACLAEMLFGWLR